MSNRIPKFKFQTEYTQWFQIQQDNSWFSARNAAGKEAASPFGFCASGVRRYWVLPKGVKRIRFGVSREPDPEAIMVRWFSQDKQWKYMSTGQPDRAVDFWYPCPVRDFLRNVLYKLMPRPIDYASAYVTLEYEV